MGFNIPENLSEIREILKGAAAGTSSLNVTTGGVAADGTTTGSITAAQPTQNSPIASATVQANMAGYYGVSATLSGTWAATAVFDCSSDGGATWNQMTVFTSGTNIATTSVTANGTYLFFGIGGASQVRVRASSYTSGTIAVTIKATVSQVLADAVYPVVTELSGSASSATTFTNMASVDVSAYRSLSMQMVGTTNSTATWEFSNDNTNWIGFQANIVNGTSFTTTAGTTTTINNIYNAPVQGRYFRLRLSSYTSGTMTATIELSSQPTMQMVAAVTGNLGSATTSSAVTTNFRSVALTNAAVTVKAAAGNVYGWVGTNGKVAGSLNSTPSYVHIYDLASASVVVGTTVPVLSITLPANGSDTEMCPLPFVRCATQVSAAVTTSPDGLTATAPTNNVVITVITN